MLSKVLARILGHAAIVAELRAIEEETLDAYFQVIVSDKERDWHALYEADVTRHAYYGYKEPPRYRSRQEYMDKVRWDFDRVRESIRHRLVRGIFNLGPTCYDGDSMNELTDRLHM